MRNTVERPADDVDDHDHRAGGMTVTSAITFLHVLAAEGPKNSNIWNPTIIGILTVLAAIGLFCGSVYLLLATNLGARLGFLVAAAGLSGFMLLLATLWWTSGSSGIDPPHGRSPQWKVVEIPPSPDKSKVPAIRDIAKTGKLIPPEQLTNLKPAVDQAIVPDKSLHGETPKEKPFANLGFTEASDYLAEGDSLKSYEVGGGTKNIFWHNTKYAIVQLCVVQKNVTPPTCDPLKDTPYIVLKHDLGTLRQPVVAYWFMSVLLFGLSLLGLHWYEQDQRARRRAGLAPVPSPGS